MIPIFRVIGAFLKGAVRSFPLGNAIIKGVETAKGGALKTVLTADGDVVKGQVKDPNAWLKIVVEVAVTGAVIWAFLTKAITADDMIRVLGLSGQP